MQKNKTLNFYNIIIILSIFSTTLITTLYADDDKKKSKEPVSNSKHDGKVLWEIFNDSHQSALKVIKTDSNKRKNEKKSILTHLQMGYFNERQWLYGGGIEFKIGTLIVPVTLACKFDATGRNQKRFITYGSGIHIPGNFFSSNAGFGAIWDLRNGKHSLYSLVGIELFNLLFSEYQINKNIPDLLRFGIRYYF